MMVTPAGLASALAALGWVKLSKVAIQRMLSDAQPRVHFRSEI
jgi:hypothetical protein